MSKKTPYENIIDTLQLVRDGVLDADPRFLETPIDELLKICNGCGAAGAKIDFVPDTIWGLSVRPVCNLHDFDYHFGITISHKESGDRRMLNNNLRMIQAYSSRMLRKLRRIRALTYYKTVKYFGGPAFWSNKVDPNG